MRYKAVKPHLSQLRELDHTKTQGRHCSKVQRLVTSEPKQYCHQQYTSMPQSPRQNHVLSLLLASFFCIRLGQKTARIKHAKTTMASSNTEFLCSCNQILRTTNDVDVHDKSWLALGHDKRCRYPGCTTISPQTSNAKRHWRTHLPDRLGKYFCSNAM